jgi:hypothetical protein
MMNHERHRMIRDHPDFGDDKKCPCPRRLIAPSIRARRQAAGRPLAMSDGLIAATALVHDLTLWTRNTHDFTGTGVRLFDPWED